MLIEKNVLNRFDGLTNCIYIIFFLSKNFIMSTCIKTHYNFNTKATKYIQVQSNLYWKVSNCNCCSTLILLNRGCSKKT